VKVPLLAKVPLKVKSRAVETVELAAIVTPLKVKTGLPVPEILWLDPEKVVVPAVWL